LEAAASQRLAQEVFEALQVRCLARVSPLLLLCSPINLVALMVSLFPRLDTNHTNLKAIETIEQ
jgi:hypothetical protein